MPDEPRQPRRSTNAFRVALTLLWILGGATSAIAQLPPVVQEPGPADIAKSQRQREDVALLARRHLGSPLRGGDLRDLEVLQRLLDRNVVDREDVLGLQALGVVLGDVMASNLPLDWVTIDDEYGHSRALRLGKTDNLYFPITMISKRVVNREQVDVQALYDKVAGDVELLESRKRPKRRRIQLPPRPVFGEGGSGDEKAGD